MEKYTTKKKVTLHAYSLGKHSIKDIHNNEFLKAIELLSDHLLSLPKIEDRMESIYEKNDTDLKLKASRFVAYQEKDKDALFGSFYSFDSARLKLFLEKSSLQQEVITKKDIKEDESSSDKLEYKSDFYFYMVNDILITTSHSYKAFEDHVNYLLDKTSFNNNLSVVKMLRKDSDYKFSDINQLVFYDWVDSNVQKELVKKIDSPIAKLSKELISNTLNTISDTLGVSSHSERLSYIQFKASLTCDIEKSDHITEEEYAKQLGFSLRFTDEMKGKVAFKTRNGQTIDGHSVVEKRIVDIPANKETISQSEILKEMRKYAQKLHKERSA